MKKYIALIVAVIVLAGGALVSQQWFAESLVPTIATVESATTTSKQVASPAPPPPQAQVPPPQSTPAPASSQGNSFTFTAATEGTVLDSMHALAADGKLSFSGREFAGLGYLVEEINGRRSADGYYWILRVNGVLSDQGVSQARVESNDVIEWRYEKGY